jgi:uncharacterized protein DUF3300
VPTASKILVTVVLLLDLSVTHAAMGQPSQQSNAPAFKAEELEQLLAPIALYPDDLIAQILTAANTTTAYDGVYRGIAIQNISKGNTLAVTGSDAPVNCPNYSVPPPLTVSNGLAQFQALGLTFQGYVTPQGALAMRSGDGHTLTGQIDNRSVLSGQVLAACAYNASWRKSS